MLHVCIYKHLCWLQLRNQHCYPTGICYSQGYTVYVPHFILITITNSQQNMLKESVCDYSSQWVLPYLDPKKSGIVQFITHPVCFWQLPFEQIHEIPRRSPQIIMLTMSSNHCPWSFLLGSSNNNKVTRAFWASFVNNT